MLKGFWLSALLAGLLALGVVILSGCPEEKEEGADLARFESNYVGTFYRGEEVMVKNFTATIDASGNVNIKLGPYFGDKTATGTINAAGVLHAEAVLAHGSMGDDTILAFDCSEGELTYMRGSWTINGESQGVWHMLPASEASPWAQSYDNITGSLKGDIDQYCMGHVTSDSQAPAFLLNLIDGAAVISQTKALVHPDGSIDNFTVTATFPGISGQTVLDFTATARVYGIYLIIEGTWSGGGRTGTWQVKTMGN